MSNAKNSKMWNFVALHTIVLFWGATGLVGEMITMPAHSIVFYRMAIALLPLFLYLRWSQGAVHRGISGRRKLLCMLSGVCIAVHWWCFFESIKVSTVSIGLITLSAGPFFIALLEPLFGRSRLRVSEVILGGACVASLVLIFNFESQYARGILIGIGAALCDAVYSIVTSRLVRHHPSLYVALLQMLGGTIFFGLVNCLAFGPSEWLVIDSQANFWGLMFLGVLCTAIALAIYINCLRTISTFTAVLAINLEPVYGIVLALLLYGEKELMSVGFYLGACMLISSIAIDGVLKSRQSGERGEHSPSAT